MDYINSLFWLLCLFYPYLHILHVSQLPNANFHANNYGDTIPILDLVINLTLINELLYTVHL